MAPGHLTEHVADEINNPLAYISCNVGRLKSDLHDLFRVLGAYQDRYTAEECAGKDMIQDLERHIDSHVLWKDLQSLIAHVQEGVDRVKRTERELPNFHAAAKQDAKKPTYTPRSTARSSLLHAALARVSRLRKRSVRSG